MKNKIFLTIFFCLLGMYAFATGITGNIPVCAGSGITLTGSPTGGTWTSGNTSIATVTYSGTTTTLTGVSAGTVIITYAYTSGGGGTITAIATVNPLPATISGPSPAYICAGTSMTLSDATAGGTWSLSGSVATINSSTGVITVPSTVSMTSTLTVTYTVGGCHTTFSVMPTPNPDGILGNGVSTGICAGTSVSLSDATTGGTWSTSGNISVASGTTNPVNATGGATGTSEVTYTLPTGCMAVKPVTIFANPAPIEGDFIVCVGGTTTLTDPTDPSGAAWTSSNTAIATCSGFYIHGISVGTAVITYQLSTAYNSCYITQDVSVDAVPAAISGASSICVNSSTTLTDATSGGTWSSSNSAIGSIGSTSGTITGITSGIVTITYSLAGAGCYVTRVETVNPLPGPINGNTGILCIGSTMSLTDATSGGTWSSTDFGTGTVSSSGIVRGVGSGSGTTVISYTLATGCASTTTVNVDPTVIYGPLSVCVGSSITLTDGAGGGTWTSTTTSVATVGSGSGIVTGVNAGTTTISYAHSSGCIAPPVVVTAYPLPSAITGMSSICAGSTAALTDAGGGTWSSSNTGVATINSSGVVSALSAGTTIITYTLSTGCYVTATESVNALPSPITGTMSVCIGSSTVLTDDGGGTWGSSNTAVATVDASGNVTGLTAGTANITYTLSTGCYTTVTVTVNALPSAITGILSVCAGSATSLTDAGGGTWSSSNTAVAMVDASGNVTGVSAGTAVITYILSTGCYTTVTVTVNPLPSAITGTLSVCAGSVTSLTDAGSGTWSSSNTAVATVDASGNVTGVAAGTAMITYTSVAGCVTSVTATTSPLPAADSISGSPTVYMGSTTALTDASVGGVWSSSNPLIATVNSAGLVTGVAIGTVAISYAVTNSCGTAITYTVLSVTSSSCLTNSISINTGVGVVPVADGANPAGHTDPEWIVTAISGDAEGAISSSPAATAPHFFTAVIPPGAADAVDRAPFAPLWSILGGSEWISCLNSIYYQTTNPTGDYTMVLARTFTVCGSCCHVDSVPVTINFNYFCDNAATIFIDNIAYPSTVVGGPTTMGSFSFTKGLSCGPHTLSVQITNFDIIGFTFSFDNLANIPEFNPTGLDLTGTITAPGNELVMDGCAFAGCPAPTPPGPILGANTICTGGTISLSDATSGGTWNASPSGIVSFSSTSSNPTIVTGNSAGTVVITYTTLCGDTKTTIVTVNPTPEFTISPFPSSCVCSEMAYSLTANCTSGCEGAYYYWSSGTDHSTSNPYAHPGVISIECPIQNKSTLTVTNMYGCSATESYYEDIYAKPTETLITGPTQACSGSTVTLCGHPGSCSDGSWAIVSYQLLPSLTWHPWNAIYSFISGIYFSGFSTGSGQCTTLVCGSKTSITEPVVLLMSYTVHSPCTSCPPVTAYYTVTINPTPDFTISGPTSACSGAILSYTADCTSGCAVPTYSWSSMSATSTGNPFTVGPVSVTACGGISVEVILTMTNVYGCSATKFHTTNVCPPPIPGHISGPSAVCAGSTETYSVTGNNCPGVWSLTPGVSDGIEFIRDPLTGTVINKFTGAVTFGNVTCVTNEIIQYAVTTCCRSEVTTYNVSINFMPDAKAKYSGCIPACPCNPIIISVTGTGGSTVNYRYKWPGGTFISGSVTLLPAATGPCPSTVTNYITIAPPTPCEGLTGEFIFDMENVTLNGCTRSAPTEMPVLIGAPTATLYPDSSPLCSNDPFCITVTGTAGSTVYITAGFGYGAPLVRHLPGTLGLSSVTICDLHVNPTTGTNTYCISEIEGPCCTVVSTIANPLPCITVTAPIAPGPITGNAPICGIGSTIILADDISGGVWSSSNTTVALVNSLGVVTGVGAGTAVISYGVSDGCYATITVTVVAEPTVTCWTELNVTTGIEESGFNLSPAVSGVTVDFTAEVSCWSSTMGGCFCNTFDDCTPSPSFTPFILTPPSTQVYPPASPELTITGSYIPPCEVLALNMTSISYEGCTWADSCSSVSARSATGGTGNSSSIRNKTGMLTVAPNPNKGTLTISGTLQGTVTSKEAGIEVLDMLGRTILTDVATVTDGAISKNITLDDNIANGVYLIKIKNDDGSQVLRFTLDR